MTDIPEHLLHRAQKAKERARSVVQDSAGVAAEKIINDAITSAAEQLKSVLSGTIKDFTKVNTRQDGPRTFKVIRPQDVTGVSGTGVVAEGAIFSNGRVAVTWLSDNSCVSVWDNLEMFLNVHVRTHPENHTKIAFSDGEVYEHTPGSS